MVTVTYADGSTEEVQLGSGLPDHAREAVDLRSRLLESHNARGELLNTIPWVAVAGFVCGLITGIALGTLL